MPFPRELDFDSVLSKALPALWDAIGKWKKGQPKSEEALMNQITGALARDRRGCNVGNNGHVTMRAQSALLHRRGHNQVDLYGADLAVTVFIDSIPFVKTAFFQLKKSNDFRTQIESIQISQASAYSGIKERSFALIVDESVNSFRIRHISDIEPEIPAGQNSKQFDCSRWSFFSEWLWNWLSCDTGAPTDINNPNKVENLLTKFIQQDNWDSPWGSSFEEPLNLSDDELPDILPCKAWLVLIFEKQVVVSNAQ